jgi:HEAT repeat protein
MTLWETNWKENFRIHTCRRLPDGNTFLAADGTFVELGHSGNPVYQHQELQLPLINAAYKLDDNQTIRLATWGDSLLEVDARSGEELSRTKIPLPPPWRSPLQLLTLSPDGQVFCLFLKEEKVVHFNPAGKVMWERVVKGVRRVAGSLPGGNVVLWCFASPPSDRVLEMDRTGRVVWEAFSEDDLVAVQPCFALIRVGFTGPRPQGVTVDSVAYRLQGLKSKSLATRRRSASALRGFGAAAKEAIPLLIDLLGEGDRLIREYGGDALVSIGKASIPVLLKTLKDRNPLKRAEAAMCLGRIKGEPESVLPALIEALKDRNFGVRRASVGALGCFGPEAKEAVAPLIKMLDDKGKPEIGDLRICEIAMDALERIGPTAKEAIPKLLLLLKAKDKGLRRWAFHALAGVARGDPAVVKVLLTVLQTDKDIGDRGGAVGALGRMGKTARGAVPALVEALKVPKGTDPRVALDFQEQILIALGKLGAEAKEAVPGLIALLKDKTQQEYLRIRVAYALGDIGPAAVAALPALKEVAREQDSPLRDAIAEALRAIEKPK